MISAQVVDSGARKRKYEIAGLKENSGIAKVKRVLNELHLEMVSTCRVRRRARSSGKRCQ